MGAVLSVVFATLFEFRGAPTSGNSRTAISIDWDSEYSPNWLLTADEQGLGWTRRGRAVVSPRSYGMQGGTTAPSLLLELGAADPPIPPFPIAMHAHGNISDLAPAVLQQIKSGMPGGTILIWPIETRFGWPMRCLRYWNDGVYGWGSFGFAAGSTPQRVVGGVTITPGKGPFDRKVLPYEPIPLGLLVNTLVMGGFVFCFGAMRRWAVRQERRIRGRCEKCGYDLTGVVASVCPECGAERAVQPVVADRG